MIGMDDSERNYDIVLMIKKIALAIEKKDTKDLQAIAQELEAWEPRENWDDMDIRTKVFVEHVLVALARIQLGLDVLDQGASELTEIRQEVEEKEMNDAVLDSLDEEDYAAAKTWFVCFKCAQKTVGKAVLEDNFGHKMCEKCARVLGRKGMSGLDEHHGRYDELVREYDESIKEIDETQKRTRENIDRFTRRNLSNVDDDEKFTCEKCGVLKRKSAPGVSNYKEVDGHIICGRCYRAFTNWFDAKESTKRRKQFEKLEKHYDNPQKRSWDEREKDKTRLYNNIRKLMRYFRKDDGQIDWKKYHEAERKERERLEKEERNKARYKKNELSDDEKEDLK